MPRVLFVTLGLNLSGQSIHLANLGKGLQRLGWDLGIAAGNLADGEPLGREFFLDRNFEVVEIPFSGWGLGFGYATDQYRAIRAMRDFIPRYRPDVINIHSATLVPVVRAATPRGGTPPAVVTTLNNERIEGSKQVIARAANSVFRDPLGQRVIAISSPMRDLAIQALRISPGAIRKIDYAVDDEYFRLPTAQERSEARSLLGLSQDDFVVCCVGRLEPRKNQEALIRAGALLRGSGTSVRLVLAGESIGDYGSRLKQLALEQGIQEAISFTGFLDARTVYWASDVNVLPSTLEGFGLVVVEGILCGALAVRSASAGASDQIEHGRTGLLIDANTPSSIADALESVVANPAKAQHMRRAAYERVAGRFTLDRMASQVAEIYAEAIRSANGSA